MEELAIQMAMARVSWQISEFAYKYNKKYRKFSSFHSQASEIYITNNSSKNIFGIKKNALVVSLSQSRIFERIVYVTLLTFEALVVSFHLSIRDLEFLFMV